MSMPIPLGYVFTVEERIIRRRYIIGNKKECQKIINWELEDNNFNRFQEIKRDVDITHMERKDTLYE